ncbi:hypothetical protein [Savagea faecisuis]|uniref:Uncharacterized protein n=1 Tax=Savagea faecisuis TaxID=1274803 RepID=A0ABW3GYS7_9BACL
MERYVFEVVRQAIVQLERPEVIHYRQERIDFFYEGDQSYPHHFIFRDEYYLLTYELNGLGPLQINIERFRWDLQFQKWLKQKNEFSDES